MAFPGQYQVNHRELDGDWFQSIRDKLNWNLRTLQLPFQGDQATQDIDFSEPSRQARARSSSYSGRRESGGGGGESPPGRLFDLSPGSGDDFEKGSPRDGPKGSPI